MISSLLFFFALEGGGKLVVVEGVGSANCSADTSMEIAVAFELLHRLITDRNAVVNVAQTTFLSLLLLVILSMNSQFRYMINGLKSEST